MVEGVSRILFLILKKIIIIIFVILSKNEAKESRKPLIKLYVLNQFGPLNIEGRYRKPSQERERERERGGSTCKPRWS